MSRERIAARTRLRNNKYTNNTGQCETLRRYDTLNCALREVNKSRKLHSINIFPSSVSLRAPRATNTPLDCWENHDGKRVYIKRKESKKRYTTSDVAWLVRLSISKIRNSKQAASSGPLSRRVSVCRPHIDATYLPSPAPPPLNPLSLVNAGSENTSWSYSDRRRSCCT